MDEQANRTADEGIKYKKDGADQLISYSDSNWAVAHSTTGFCITYGGTAVSYGSKLPHCISLSSSETEIVAASLTAVEVFYLRGSLAEIGREQLRATPMYVDNSGAVELSNSRRSVAPINALGMSIEAT
eukprot:3326621-Pleurochrysis_carterae.AAC.6